MNPKNQLQEFCQKRSMVLPRYDTVQIESIYNYPQFNCRVILTYNNIIYQTDGYNKSNKKKAELSAANAMLNKLDEIRTSETQYYESKNVNVIIYIDMENIHIGDFFETRKFGKGIYFQGVVTDNHSSIKAAPKELKIHTIQSDRRDAADMLIVWLAAQQDSGSTIVVITKDHFGSGLVDIINDVKYGCGSVGVRLKTMDKLHEWLNQYRVSILSH
uniref:Double-stranded RNA binding motif-containing protein n=1 Tax=Pithovirus LCPAC302 TaxID=2506593 RepID=A0A481ZAK3_9VIRU|nr:MAG: double-stranded RNA binding motif-containing protein [Pithovirus LCPAC302]